MEGKSIEQIFAEDFRWLIETKSRTTELGKKISSRIREVLDIFAGAHGLSIDWWDYAGSNEDGGGGHLLESIDKGAIKIALYLKRAYTLAPGLSFNVDDLYEFLRVLPIHFLYMQDDELINEAKAEFKRSCDSEAEAKKARAKEELDRKIQDVERLKDEISAAAASTNR